MSMTMLETPTERTAQRESNHRQSEEELVKEWTLFVMMMERPMERILWDYTADRAADGVSMTNSRCVSSPVPFTVLI
jgi:hypothetical protein